MSNLVGLKTRTAEAILQKLNSFLLGQKSESTTFNYWAVNSSEYSKIPYPDDLDDTFTALAAIHQYNPKSLSGSDMRKITEVLVHQETKTGGPYFTWVYKKNDVEWKDIDVAVNSNVAFFLSQLDIVLPNIVEYIEKAIQDEKLVSKYYPQASPIGYFISKWYKGPQEEALIKFLEDRYSSSDATFLDKLLVAIALLNYLKTDHPIIKKVYSKLVSEPETANNSYPFYRGVNPFGDGKKYYAGSPSLTISFAIEFLLKYEKILEDPVSKREMPSLLNEVNTKTFAKIHDDFVKVGGGIAKLGLKRLGSLAKNPDMALITSVPFIAHQALGTRRRPSKLLDDLCVATLYGWLAYDIYDDFFDDEGAPPDLSVANFALRKLTDIFTSKDLGEEFRAFFHTTMNIVDEANLKESSLGKITVKKNVVDLTEKCDYVGEPYEKSIGHIIGIIAVYSLSGYSVKSRKVRDTTRFFKYYLSARQLIDDMHDWEDDLKRGKLNIVSSKMIQELAKKGKKRITFDKLRTFFWEETVVTCSDEVQGYIDKSERVSTPFNELMKPFKKVVEQTLSERRATIEFLADE